MVGFSPRRRRHKMRSAATGRRVILLFGPPGSGVSTVLDAFSASTETPNEVVPYVERSSIREVEAAMERSELVLLDVPGGLFGVQDVQDLVDNRIVYQGSGAIIRLYAPNESIVERAAKERPDYVSIDDLISWLGELSPIESRIREHNIDYFMVPNVDLVEAVTQLAKRASVYN